MITQYKNNITQSATYAVLASGTILSLLFMGFFLAEPAIGQAVNSTDFYVRATVTSENSFLVQPNNVSMTGSISGLTGGQATGTSQFVVLTNNAAGYTVSIDFFDNTGAQSMAGDIDGSEAIRDYSGDVGGQPSYGRTASTAAQFAYTVTSTTTTDTDLSFLNNGAACNAGAAQTPLKCWKAPSTAPFQIVTRGSSAPTGATSTITFNITVPNSPVPVPEAQTYTATATLSLLAL
ncbi:MAG: hypothetical protein RLZZ230_80 [Candidatus Parcubacteria bacterium]